MSKQFLLALLAMFLLTLSAAAQNGEEEIAENDPDITINGLMVNRTLNLLPEHDASGMFFMLLHDGRNHPVFSGIVKELGITEEQHKLALERSVDVPDDWGERTKVFNEIADRFRSGNYEVSETELEAIDDVLSYALEASSRMVSEIYSAEQIAKLDGMILALSGGLASPLFNERHMAALDMTEEQKQKFASINEEMKGEREKMAAGVSAKFMSMLMKEEFNVQDLLTKLSDFREFSNELKKRRSAVLTAAQIRKVRTLSRLPQSLSVYNLLPKWMPNADSWKPGDPVPEGLTPENKQTRPFPREEK